MVKGFRCSVLGYGLKVKKVCRKDNTVNIPSYLVTGIKITQKGR